MSVHPDTASAKTSSIRVESDSSIQSFLLHGSERFGITGNVLPVYNPADQVSQVGQCHSAELLHVEVIERAAEQGFAVYRKSKPDQRAAILNRLADLLQARQEELAILITRECGKPITFSRQEVERSIALCRGYVREVERQENRLIYTDGREARISRFPIGPVLAITPFNFPLNLIMHKLAPAIAAGCSITIKPAPKTPLTALFLGRLAVQAGYEAISVIPTVDHTVAEALVRSDTFRKLSFTGSAAVGWRLREIAGSKSVTLELGGVAPLIIEELTEPLEAMAQRAAFGAFAYAGQICISVQRILVNERLKDVFIPALVDASRAMSVGDPMKVETRVGPMITMEALQRSRTMIKEALKAGANVVYGGNTFNAFTLNPTIIDRTTPDMAINTEEVFAPIVTVATYPNFDEALRLANHSRFGIQAGVYTNNPQQIEQAFQELEAGSVLINEIPTYRADLLPYGGVKTSGIGREGILCGIDEYSTLKTLIRKSH
jgi:acyl-CoA reductase-like NAD-dependent aldehyde dehydrogenase